VVQSGEFGPVKIGRSKNVNARLRALQTGHPEPLKLIAVGAGLGDMELDVHYAFALCKMSGEWFTWTYYLREFVLLIRRGVVPTDADIDSFHNVLRICGVNPLTREEAVTFEYAGL